MSTLDEILHRPIDPALIGRGEVKGVQPMGYTGPRKLLIVLPFWSGDRDAMADLCRLLADIEPTLNKSADIMLYRRGDAEPMDADVRQKLASRFGRVHLHVCRRHNIAGYPYAPNEMFYDLIEWLRQPKYQQEYFAFLNMESDCVPLSTDWIAQLIAEFRALTADETKFAIGHIHGGLTPDGRNNGPIHLNGAALYAINIWDKAGGVRIIGGNPRIAYDFEHADKLVPIAVDTPLMNFRWRHMTTTAEELFGLRKTERKPVFYHGVKDSSAREAVRRVVVERCPV